MKKIIWVLIFLNAALILNAQPLSTKTGIDDSLLIQKAKEILKYCKAKQYYKLAKYIHPTDGARFSPLAHVVAESDQILFAKDFRKPNRKTYFWGYRDNSEDSIILSIPDFFDEIIFTDKALFHNQIEYNNFYADNDISNNMDVYYKNDDFLGFYYPGGKEPDNLDWKIVRLVFRKYKTTHYLVGIMCEILLR
ncbi:MAG: hypothetical protein IPM95_10840 [Sphingobacteriales bacterium]|nr:hypothetical protein [Sphingobacteriales bacterium]